MSNPRSQQPATFFIALVAERVQLAFRIHRDLTAHATLIAPGAHGTVVTCAVLAALFVLTQPRAAAAMDARNTEAPHRLLADATRPHRKRALLLGGILLPLAAVVRAVVEVLLA